MKNQRRILAGLGIALLLSLIGWLPPAMRSASAQSGCSDLIKDGGFEVGDAWELGVTQLMAEYVTYTRHSGDRSLAMGITRGGNKQGFSSARQPVTIPAGATKVMLSFWAYTMVEGYAGADRMQAILLNPDGSVLATPWQSSNDGRVWNQFTFDITRWRGRTVQLYFSVYNDGTHGTAGMFLDDVSLTVCPAATPTATRTSTPTSGVTPPWPTLPPTATRSPTGTRTATPWPSPTSTPTPTPLPPYCADILGNGGFEFDLPPWEAGPSSWPVQRVTFPWPVHTNFWTLRLGITWQDQNLTTHSPVRQVVTIPTGSQTATLRFWAWTWSESLTGADRQEARLFAADATLLDTFLFSLSNNQSWQQIESDLTRFGGQTIQLLFNVYNDGANGRAALFLDDVSLIVCNPNIPLAAPPQAAVAPALPWPDLNRVPVPAGPVGVFRAGPAAGAATVGPGVTSEPRLTRVALVLTPVPSATVGPIWTPTIAATPAWARGTAALPGQVLATWQARWWVVVVVLVIATAAAFLLNRRRAAP